MSVERYPGYDVLAKRPTLSWNDKTRQVIDQRLAIDREPRFFTVPEWRTLNALCDRILPQPANRPPVPLAAYVDEKLRTDSRDGFRHVGLPPQREAWRVGLAALDETARSRAQPSFADLLAARRDSFISEMQSGVLDGPAWRGMSSALFFKHRVLPDITAAYYAHPTAWSEIGFGGPASPRGYVRMGYDRHDPWEAEAAGADPEAAARRNRDVV